MLLYKKYKIKYMIEQFSLYYVKITKIEKCWTLAQKNNRGSCKYVNI